MESIRINGNMFMTRKSITYKFPRHGFESVERKSFFFSLAANKAAEQTAKKAGIINLRIILVLKGIACSKKYV
jgi:hypothetical protein